MVARIENVAQEARGIEGLEGFLHLAFRKASHASEARSSP